MENRISSYLAHDILAVSWASELTDDLKLGDLFDDWTVIKDHNWLLACENPRAISVAKNRVCAIKPQSILRNNCGNALSAAHFGEYIYTQKSFDDYAAPATGFWCEKNTICAATDSFGLGQVFYIQLPGFCAISTSATLLAEITGAPLNLAALTGFALTGGFIGDASAFTGIVKIPAGHQVRVEAGQLQQSPRTNANITDMTADAGKPEQLAAHFVRAVKVMRAAYPDAALELSGGLDSRLILAAIPKEERASLRALTIGPEHSSDVKIARKIAAQNGMEHQIAEIGDFSDWDAAALADFLKPIARGYDHAANPLDKAAILVAESAFNTPARFAGQNGEILRGFYYPLQPLDAAPSPQLARKLIDWRLITNDRVMPALTATTVFKELEQSARDTLEQQILSCSGKWGEVLDRFYLSERMQRWAGAACSNKYVTRTILYPFFDTSFVAAALVASPQSRKRSGLAFEMLKMLDPDLAAMPLDSGLVPAHHGTWRMGVATAREFSMKLASKVRGRLLKNTRATLGSGDVASRWHELGLYRDLPYEELLATGLFAKPALDNIMSGKTEPDRPTLGFLLLMSSLLQRKLTPLWLNQPRP